MIVPLRLRPHILGFSNFIRENSHKEVVKIYQSTFRSLIDLSLAEVAEQSLGNSSWIEAIKNYTDKDDLAPKLDNVALNCMTISDSIILTTSDCKIQDFMTLAFTVRNLMARLLYFGFPLRGAISYGMLTSDRDIPASGAKIIHHQMLGLPLVEAANLEKRQCWSGCAIHENVLKKLGTRIIWLDPITLTTYNVPMNETHTKSGTVLTEKMWVINWVQGIADNDKIKINMQKIRSAFTDHGKKIADVDQKIENTIRFFEEMSDHPLYKNEMNLEEYLNLIRNELKEKSLQK